MCLGVFTCVWAFIGCAPFEGTELSGSAPSAGLPGFAGENLPAYLERKLFTMNTGHATTAYLGHLKGYPPRGPFSPSPARPFVRPHLSAHHNPSCPTSAVWLLFF